MPDDFLDLAPGSGDTAALVKAHVLSVAQVPGGVSTQKLEEQWLQTPEGALEPPLNLDMLAMLSTFNQVRRSCVGAIARNTVGLGYELSADYGREKEVSDPTELVNEACAKLEACASRDVRLERPGFVELLAACKTDVEEIGNGYIEVSRDKRDGSIDGLFHAPGKFVRRRRDRSGYLMIDPHDPTKTVSFANYGEKVAYDNSGKPTRQLVPGAGWERNELLAIRQYTSESTDYGLPKDAAMVLEYLADKLATETNVSFFGAGGTPPSILFVQGKETNQGGRIEIDVPPEVAQAIAGAVRSDASNQKKVVVVPIPAGVQAQHIKLGEFSDRDVGYTGFRADEGRRTIAAFGLQPIFVPAIPDEGRYTAEVQRAVVLEATFDPDQSVLERKLTNTILRDLGYPELQLTLKRLAVESDSARRDSADKLAEAGNITRREHRAAHGYAPLPEGDGDGQVPSGWNDELVNLAKPEGAENRLDPGERDQRGLQPGLAARRQRSQPSEVVTGDPRVNGAS